MRVLLYIEPHPLRDSSVMFRAVARKYAKLLTSNKDFDFRLYANSDTLKDIQNDLVGKESYILYPSKQDEKIFLKYKKDWNKEGIPLWKELMSGHGSVSQEYDDLLARLWSRFPFDVIVHWGENGAISSFINKRSIFRIAMELGCSRPPFLDSIVLDVFGTNGSAVTPKLTIKELKSIVGDSYMSRHEAILAYSESIECLNYEMQFKPLNHEFLKKISKLEKIAFLPLQLYDDANLLQFSKYDTLSDVVLDVVPILADSGYTTIITPHPSTKERPQGIFETQLARKSLEKYDDKIIWMEPTPDRPSNQQLIVLSDVVITVNSSVGFESLYFDKPVVVLGSAIYKPKDLFPNLREFLNNEYNHEEYLRNIGILRRFFLGGYLLPPSILNSPTHFSEKLLLIASLFSSCRSDPYKIAEGYWRYNSKSIQTAAEYNSLFGNSNPKSHNFQDPRQDNGALRILKANETWEKAATEILDKYNLSRICELQSKVSSIASKKSELAILLADAGLIDIDYYNDQNPDVREAGIDPAMHFVEFGAFEKRKFNPNLECFSLQEIVDRIVDAGTQVIEKENNCYLKFPLNKEESEERKLQLRTIEQDLSKSKNQICIIVHLAHTDNVSFIVQKINNIKLGYDLIVTLPTWGYAKIKAMVLEVYPEAKFYHAPDRGLSYGPLFDLLETIILRYKYSLIVNNLETHYWSNDLLVDENGQYFKTCIESLIGSSKRVEQIIALLDDDPYVNMIYPARNNLIFSNNDLSYYNKYSEVILGKHIPKPYNCGSMFWFRTSTFERICDPLNLTIESFPPFLSTDDSVLIKNTTVLMAQLAQAEGFAATVDDDPAILVSIVRS